MLTECFKVGEEGLKEEGEERLGKLICVLLSQSKVEEAKKVAEDEGVRKEYYTLYNI